MGVAQTFWTPKRDHFKTQINKKYINFSRATLNETFTAQCNSVLPRTPYVRIMTKTPHEYIRVAYE